MTPVDLEVWKPVCFMGRKLTPFAQAEFARAQALRDALAGHDMVVWPMAVRSVSVRIRTGVIRSLIVINLWGDSRSCRAVVVPTVMHALWSTVVVHVHSFFNSVTDQRCWPYVPKCVTQAWVHMDSALLGSAYMCSLSRSV